MSLKQKIIDDLKSAMKSGDTARRDALRMLDSMVKNVEIEKKKREEGLSDVEVQEVINRAVKQRKDAAEQYTLANRPELAEKENKEIEIFLAYMPEQLSEEEVRKQVEGIVKELGASSQSDMGKVMGAAMAKLKGRTDGNLVKKIVEEKLS